MQRALSSPSDSFSTVRLTDLCDLAGLAGARRLLALHERRLGWLWWRCGPERSDGRRHADAGGSEGVMGGADHLGTKPVALPVERYLDGAELLEVAHQVGP